jgi:hypothetical protein
MARFQETRKRAQMKKNGRLPDNVGCPPQSSTARLSEAFAVCKHNFQDFFKKLFAAQKGNEKERGSRDGPKFPHSETRPGGKAGKAAQLELGFLQKTSGESV